MAQPIRLRCRLIGAMLLGSALVGAALRAADERPLAPYEWTQVAPVVVAGTSLGQDGRYVDFVVTDVLRGEVRVAEALRVDIRSANQDRDRELDRKALHLDAGQAYVLLLEPLGAPRDAEDKRRQFAIVRGIDGVHPLVGEGRQAYLDALRRFIEIQNANSEAVKWSALDEWLSETNPLLLSAALEQFLKFRRGTPAQAAAVPPLLDHPEAEIREQAARLAGQIVATRGAAGEAVPEEEQLRLALVARARRDASVPVRVAATQAVAQFGDAASAEVLREIASNDPEQEVRYAAEVQLLDRSRAAAPQRAPEEGPN